MEFSFYVASFSSISADGNVLRMAEGTLDMSRLVISVEAKGKPWSFTLYHQQWIVPKLQLCRQFVAFRWILFSP